MKWRREEDEEKEENKNKTMNHEGTHRKTTADILIVCTRGQFFSGDPGNVFHKVFELGLHPMSSHLVEQNIFDGNLAHVLAHTLAQVLASLSLQFLQCFRDYNGIASGKEEETPRAAAVDRLRTL